MSTTAMTSTKWIRPPPKWSANPKSHRTKRTTIIPHKIAHDNSAFAT